MGDEPTNLDDPKFKELRNKFLQEKLFQFQPVLNMIEDANWGKPITVKIKDSKWVFRKLSHAEVTLITGFPFFPKLVAQEKLDDAEMKEWLATRKAMTAALCTEPNRWLGFVEVEPLWVEVVFASLLKESMPDIPKLIDFFKSEYGYNYGFIWFLMMHRTPTEVGAMSEGDYQAINAWFREYNERMKK